MKALEKDRTHRYSSASELATDLRHHLAHEPVSAGPPSASYRLKKFARRHRVGVTVAAVLVMAFLLGFAGTAYGLLRAVRAERQTRLEAETVAQVSEFMFDMFKINDPSESRGNTITAREILDRGATQIRGDLSDQPELQGRLMGAMGIVYRSLGLYGDALPLLEGAVNSLTRAYGERHGDVVSHMTTLAGLQILKGRNDEALVTLERALEIQRGLSAAEPLETARILNNIGSVHRKAKRYEEALSSYGESLEIRERELGLDDSDVAKVLGNIGAAQTMLKDFDAARASLERALEIREARLGEDHPDVAKILNNLATLHRITREYDRVREVSARVLDIRERTLGADHPELVGSLLNLAIAEKADGNFAEAARYLERSLVIADDRLDPGHRLTRWTVEQLIEVSRELGDEERALDLEKRLPAGD